MSRKEAAERPTARALPPLRGGNSSRATPSFRYPPSAAIPLRLILFPMDNPIRSVYLTLRWHTFPPPPGTLFNRRLQLEKRYWGKHLWGIGYGVWSTGNITEDVVEEYLARHKSSANDGSDFKLD